VACSGSVWIPQHQQIESFRDDVVRRMDDVPAKPGVTGRPVPLTGAVPLTWAIPLIGAVPIKAGE